MENFNNYDTIYEGNNPQNSEMQLVLNKLRPYLSVPAEDEPNLMKRLKDLGVEDVDDLKFLNVETDLQGIMKVIQCRKLKLELSKDVTMHKSIKIKSEIQNAPSSTVKHKRDPLTQPTSIFNFTIPKFKRSVRKSLENGNVSNNDRLYIVKTMSDLMLDVARNLGTKECRQVVRMLKEQFPNAFKNKESGFSVEHVTNNLIRRQGSPQLQIYRAVSKITHQKNIKYGIHPERYVLPNPIVGIDKNILENIKSFLKLMHEILFHRKNLKWTLVAYIKMLIKMLNDYVKLKKSVIFLCVNFTFPNLQHFHFPLHILLYLTNTKETALNNFYMTIPTMFKFVQLEAEKKLKNNDLQIKLMAIIKNNSNKNSYNEFLTVLFCYMAIMKENAERMFTEPLEIQKAIEIMFMSYYVFNLQYPRELAGILQLLQDESNVVEKCLPKLSKLMNNYEDRTLVQESADPAIPTLDVVRPLGHDRLDSLVDTGNSKSGAEMTRTRSSFKSKYNHTVLEYGQWAAAHF
ncbi:hypothetical protein QTP88_029467 [Uroleucon formosanum]